MTCFSFPCIFCLCLSPSSLQECEYDRHAWWGGGHLAATQSGASWTDAQPVQPDEGRGRSLAGRECLRLVWLNVNVLISLISPSEDECFCWYVLLLWGHSVKCCFTCTVCISCHSCVRSLSVTQSDFSVCGLKHKLAQINNFHRLSWATAALQVSHTEPNPAALFQLELNHFSLCVSGPGPMEESEEEYFPGSNQEGGGEEDDGALDDRRHLYLHEEEKHQDLQRDSGGQVGDNTQTGRSVVFR